MPDHIILNVVVTDANGKPVPGLLEQDFTLRSNQQPQQILFFKAMRRAHRDTTSSRHFVMDVLNDSFGEAASGLRAMQKYLSQNHGQLSLPVSLAVLTESGIKIGSPSRDGVAFIDQLKKVRMPLATLGSQEGSNARSFHLSVQSLTRLVIGQEDVPGRVILIWLGSGWPLLSDGPYPGTPLGRSNFFGEVLNLPTGFLDAQMTVDVVSPQNVMRDQGLPQNDYRRFLQGVQRATQADPGNLSLPVLAYQSGGQIFEKNKDLASDIARCIADLNAYYVLSFDSPRTAQDVEYRRLQITVDKPGLTPRTNAFYYAHP